MRISATMASRTFADLLNRVRYRGERFVIVRGGEEVAELGPSAGAGRRTTLADVVALTRSLGSAGTGFAEDLEAVQAAQPALPEDPWAS